MLTRVFWTVADFPRVALARRRQGWSTLGAIHSAWLTSPRATREAWVYLGVGCWFAAIVSVLLRAAGVA